MWCNKHLETRITNTETALTPTQPRTLYTGSFIFKLYESNSKPRTLRAPPCAGSTAKTCTRRAPCWVLGRGGWTCGHLLKAKGKGLLLFIQRRQLRFSGLLPPHRAEERVGQQKARDAARSPQRGGAWGGLVVGTATVLSQAAAPLGNLGRRRGRA